MNAIEAFHRNRKRPESRAALIVYEKYRRAMRLEHSDLMNLSEHLHGYSIARHGSGKGWPHLDLLTQEASRYIKGKHK